MSSTERAPEPTMEEILASIRRIISDEDNSNRPEPAFAGEQVPAPEIMEAAEVADVEADTRIIDDIARVLSGSPADGGEDDDILDLTKEFGPIDAASAPEEGLTIAAEAGMPVADTASASEAYAPDTFASAGEPETARVEPVSALEQAIAALRAGMAAKLEPEPEPQFQPEPEPELKSEPEPEFVLAEVEVETVEAIVEQPVEQVTSAEEPSFWPPSQSSWASNGEAASEPASPRVNGGSHERPYSAPSFSGQSLQDSVKASLRPLLRQWIDTHMSRVLEAALRDELKDADENMSRMLTAALRDELEDTETRLRNS
jgi:cell pole-organizing protein PopZ